MADNELEITPMSQSQTLGAVVIDFDQLIQRIEQSTQPNGKPIFSEEWKQKIKWFVGGWAARGQTTKEDLDLFIEELKQFLENEGFNPDLWEILVEIIRGLAGG